MLGDIAISSGKDEKLIKKLIKLLKACDGETVLYILKQAGKDEYVADSLSGPITHHQILNLERRLAFVAQDVENFAKLLDGLGLSKPLFEKADLDGCTINTYLSNLQVAADLEDDEVENWKLKSEMVIKRVMPLKVIFNYGRLSPTSEEPDAPYERQLVSLGVQAFRTIYGRPEIRDHKDGMHIIPVDTDDFIKYDGVYYSDMWVEACGEEIEVFDINKLNK